MMMPFPASTTLRKENSFLKPSSGLRRLNLGWMDCPDTSIRVCAKVAATAVTATAKMVGPTAINRV